MSRYALAMAAGPEAARRLGHSVETLVSTYIGAVEGDEAEANARLEPALPSVDLDLTEAA